MVEEEEKKKNDEEEYKKNKMAEEEEKRKNMAEEEEKKKKVAEEDEKKKKLAEEEEKKKKADEEERKKKDEEDQKKKADDMHNREKMFEEEHIRRLIDGQRLQRFVGEKKKNEGNKGAVGGNKKKNDEADCEHMDQPSIVKPIKKRNLQKLTDVDEDRKPEKKQKSKGAKGKGVLKPIKEDEDKDYMIDDSMDVESEETTKVPVLRVRTTTQPLFKATIRLSVKQEMRLTEMGFGSFIKFPLDSLPGYLGYFLLDNLDTDSMELKFSNVCLKVTPESVHDVFGIPVGGTPVMSLPDINRDDPCLAAWFKDYPNFPKKPIRAGDLAQKILDSKADNFHFKQKFLILFANTMGSCVSNGTFWPHFLI